MTVAELLTASAPLRCLGAGLKSSAVTIYLLQKWGASGCAAVAPTNFSGNIPGEDLAIVTWDCASDPALDFQIRYGAVAGGPYPYTESSAANTRSHSWNLGHFGSGDTVYSVVVARDSLICVSTASNEISMTMP